MDVVSGAAEGGVPEPQRIQFAGRGSEYFGIWIVNVLLSVVTFGIWTAWAKVRRVQYFNGRTLVLGDPLDFLGALSCVPRAHRIFHPVQCPRDRSPCRPSNPYPDSVRPLPLGNQSVVEILRPHDFLAKREVQLAGDLLGRDQNLFRLAIARTLDVGCLLPLGGPSPAPLCGQQLSVWDHAVLRPYTHRALLRRLWLESAVLPLRRGWRSGIALALLDREWCQFLDGRNGLYHRDRSRGRSSAGHTVRHLAHVVWLGIHRPHAEHHHQRPSSRRCRDIRIRPQTPAICLDCVLQSHHLGGHLLPFAALGAGPGISISGRTRDGGAEGTRFDLR
ncbi:MAG: DUF898 family protein [Alphaproteobacteria bacterium]|nr:DUF898 family protein [Alphaproteobacteria bacterium]